MKYLMSADWWRAASIRAAKTMFQTGAALVVTQNQPQQTQPEEETPDSENRQSESTPKRQKERRAR